MNNVFVTPRNAATISSRARAACAIAAVLASCVWMAPLAHAASKSMDNAGAGSASGNPAAPALPPGMVARVNAAFITQDQLDEAVRATNQPVTPALITSVKNQLVAREVFRQAAQQAHYDTRPQVVEAVNQARTAAMITAYLRDEVKAPTITDADVKAKYTEIVSSLGQYEFKPSVIEVKDAAVATMVLGQLKNGGDFAQLAKQYSQGPGAAQGGTLTWVSFKTPIQAGQTQNWPQPLAEALVKLPEGALSSEPVKVGETYWILRVEQKRATQVPPFDQIKVALHEQLERAAIEKATASIAVNLIKNASIQQ